MAWFKAQATGNGKAEVVIDKVIGSDWEPGWVLDFFGETSARDFIDAIEALGDLNEITVRLNSPGGEVYSGIRIMNYLRSHKAKVHMIVDGIAASIASVILLAGDTRTMGIGSQVMVHDPMTGICGAYTEKELRTRADELAKIKDAIVGAYVAGTGKTEDDIRDLLSQGDVYLNSAEAVEWGFATATDEKIPAAAMADPRQFQAQVKMQIEMQTKVDAEKARADAAEQKFSELTKKYDEAADKVVALTGEISALKSPAAAEADFVIEACDQASLPALAVAMIKEKLPQAAVEQRLALAGQVRDIAKAGGIEAEQLLAHLGDPLKMMQTAIVEAKAVVDPDLDTHNHPHKPDNHAAGWSAAFSKTTK